MSEVNFAYLRKLEPHYQANIETRQSVGGKSLITLSGPAGSGKSTLIRQVVEFEKGQSVASWGEPGSLVTRGSRPDDPESYRTAAHGITKEILGARAIRGTLTNYSVHPTGDMYATGPESFAFDYNLMATLPSSLPQLGRAGFAQMHAVYVTLEPPDLKRGLQAREAHPSFAGRIEEGIANTEYALDHADKLTFVRNSHDVGGREKAADDIISIALDTYDQDTSHEIAVVEAMRKCLIGYRDR